MYKLVDLKKRVTGYKGVRLVDNDYKAPEKPVNYKVRNINSFPDNLLKIWEKAKIIKKLSSTKKEETK